MTAPVTSSSSRTSTLLCVHAFPSRRQDRSNFKFPKFDPIPPTPQANKSSLPFFLCLSRLISREAKILPTIKSLQQPQQQQRTYLLQPLSPRTALKEGRKEEIRTPRIPRFTVLIHFLSGSPTPAWEGLQLERQKVPSSPLGRRGGGRGDRDLRVPPPDPHLARPGAAPRARASTESRERLERPAGGRESEPASERAGRRARRRLGRAAGRRASCLGPGLGNRGPSPRRPMPASRTASRVRGVSPCRALLTCEAPSPGLEAGGPRRSGVPDAGPLPRRTRPGTRAPRGDAGRLPPPDTHTDTRATHTHAHPLAAGPPPARQSPNSHTHTRSSLAHLTSPGGRAPPRSTPGPTPRHGNTLPHSPPRAQIEH